MNPIFSATLKRCIEEQNEARTAYRDAMSYRESFPGRFLGRSAQEQRNAKYHHDQAWMRLARLINVEE
jgi:hypothetical protein